jgi:hypothetical protein
MTALNLETHSHPLQNRTTGLWQPRELAHRLQFYNTQTDAETPASIIFLSIQDNFNIIIPLKLNWIKLNLCQFSSNPNTEPMHINMSVVSTV